MTDALNIHMAFVCVSAHCCDDTHTHTHRYDNLTNPLMEQEMIPVSVWRTEFSWSERLEIDFTVVQNDSRNLFSLLFCIFS